MTWYEAGTILEKQRQQNADISHIQSIPFFDNLFPANLVGIMNADPIVQSDCGTDPSTPCFDPAWTPTQTFYGLQSRGNGDNPFAFFRANDWTDAQAYIDSALFRNGFPTRFMQPQYGSLAAWSTIGNSNYHALTVSLRQRLNSLTMDFNYTFSHSFDDASGLQGEDAFGDFSNGNGSFVVNPLRQGDNYASSDFDIRHLINVSAVWQMPFGRGRTFMSNAHGVAQAILGGWQLSGIYRWNTGLPLAASPFDSRQWATNWDFQSNVTPLGPIHTCPTRIGTPTSAGGTGTPKLFGGSGCNIKTIYDSFRSAYPGEVGPRNYIRLPGYMNVDLGLAKTWTMPWSEKHQLQLRWDVFNVANKQSFGLIDITRTGIGVSADAGLLRLNAPSNWSNFTQIQGNPRVMQVGARYSF